MSLFMWLLWICCGIGLQDQAGGRRPEALLAAEAGRLALQTGRVEWFRDSTGKFYTSRFATDDYILADRGDMEGVASRRADGTPATHPEYKGEGHVLVKNGHAWVHHLGALSSDRHERGPFNLGIAEIRGVGLNASMSSASVFDTLWFDAGTPPPTRTYRSTVEDGLHVVSARLGNREKKWWIDPKKGWSPVRAATYVDGELRWESRSTLRKYGDVWFPEQVEFFKKDHMNGARPYDKIRIDGAQFNAPDDAFELTPTDIGLECGTRINIYDSNRTLTEIVFWDGEKEVSDRELVARLRSGELQWGPGVKRGMERIKAQAAARRSGSPTSPKPGTNAVSATNPEDDWGKYTRRFITTYRLGVDQAQKALGILADCKRKRSKYLAGRRDEFDKIAKAVEELKQSDAGDKDKKLAALAERRARLLEPVNEIFENQLKPRLDRLPTRKQRKQAKGTSTDAASSAQKSNKRGG